MNQGAWYASQHHMRRDITALYPEIWLGYAGREPSAAASAGYLALHLQQQEDFLREALDLKKPSGKAAKSGKSGRKQK